MQETQGMQVQSLGQENPWRKEMATHSCILAWGNPMDTGAWWATVHGVAKELDRTKRPKNNNKSSISGVSPKHALSLQMVLVKTLEKETELFPPRS